ncbi:MAG TPA: diguanylate cyclase, partial [Polyangiaceae bacterium]|nr:diguanylate cyclase [Polyangiaceae bacterium]
MANADPIGPANEPRPSRSPNLVSWRPGAGVDSAQRILLIDPASDVELALELIDDGAGVALHHARTLSDALRYASKYCYQVLVVDAGATGQTPIALLEQLHALQPSAAFLLSGDGLRFPEQFSLSGNLLGSFRKPWDRQEFATAIRRALELSRARRTPRLGSPLLRVCFERVLLLGNAADFRRFERMTRLWFPPGGLVHATSLEEALLLMGQQSFDLVLSDLYLPDACGLDPLVRIRRLSPQTPVIILSPTEDRALLDQMLLAGAQDVLLKTEVDRKSLFRAMCHARQRQRADSQLQHGALHDELTSLAKRTLLQQRIANALARSRRTGNTFAVMYIDLDHFKCINDTHGHDVGDAVLVAVSQRLECAVRDYDTVARLGGDEFAILLDNLDQPNE